MKITANDVFEHGNFKFSAEASDLQLPVGRFPLSIDTDLGNGQPFQLFAQEIQDGDLMYVKYKQRMGCVILTIFND